MKTLIYLIIPFIFWIIIPNNNTEEFNKKVCNGQDCYGDYCLNVGEGTFIGHFGRWATAKGSFSQNLCVEECNYSIAEPFEN